MVTMIKKEIVISPANSFQGHDWGVWYDKNKGVIKNILVFAMFIFVFLKMLLSETEFSVEAIIGAATAATVAFKMALDKLDFFKSEVKA